MFFIMCCKKEESEGEVCSVDHRETYPVIISVDQRAGIMICHHAHDLHIMPRPKCWTADLLVVKDGVLQCECEEMACSSNAE